MSESDDIDAIREQKLADMLGEGEDDVATETAPSEPIHVESREHFEELVGRYDVALVDFYADWCGPCKMLEPIVATIAQDTPAAVLKVDTDAHQDLAMDAGIRGVPTLFLYADGEAVERLVGLQDEGTLRDLIAQFA